MFQSNYSNLTKFKVKRKGYSGYAIGILNFNRKPTGFWHFFDNFGTRREKIQYINGEKVGHYFKYNRYGKRILHTFTRGDKIIRKVIYGKSRQRWVVFDNTRF